MVRRVSGAFVFGVGAAVGQTLLVGSIGLFNNEGWPMQLAGACLVLTALTAYVAFNRREHLGLSLVRSLAALIGAALVCFVVVFPAVGAYLPSDPAWRFLLQRGSFFIGVFHLVLMAAASFVLRLPGSLKWSWLAFFLVVGFITLLIAEAILRPIYLDVQRNDLYSFSVAGFYTVAIWTAAAWLGPPAVTQRSVA